MDRGYLDFDRLYTFNQAGSFFVTRARSDFAFKRIYSQPVDRHTGLICDQTIELTVFRSRRGYPERLRRIRYRDPEGRRLVFLTNHMTLPARTICELYRLRWQVELFFKWIKQHLSIKRFFGTSENAVKTQVWVAVSVYVLVAIVRKELNLPGAGVPPASVVAASSCEPPGEAHTLSGAHHSSLSTRVASAAPAASFKSPTLLSGFCRKQLF